ncbi:MAG: 2-oxoglutarate synthase, partial [Proteobacteria bacterium]
MTSSSISLAITGSGGAGVVVVGQLLLRAAGRAGLYGLMHRSAGPQIRGGESLSMLRISNRAVAAQDDDFDFLFAFDWKNFSRFMAEVPLNDSSVVFADETAGPLPGQLAARGFRAMVLPLGAVASSIKGGPPNMVLLGALAGLLDIDPAIVSSVAASR